jgi:hypothetical protein
MLDYGLISACERWIISEARYERAMKRIFLKKGKVGLSFSEKIEELYSLLGILDSKDSSLLRFDGIILAVLALIIGQNNYDQISDIKIAWLVILILNIIVSMVLCLIVVGVAWRFLTISIPESMYHEFAVNNCTDD